MWNFDTFTTNIAFVTEEGRQISYGQLKKDAVQLHRLIGKRCLVFHLCKLSYGSVLGYVSCLEHNVVPVLLDAKLDAELLYHLIQVYKPDYLWTPQESAEPFCSRQGWEKAMELEGFVLIKTPFQETYPLHNDLALLLTTSGSTGSPKLVRQTYDNIYSNTQSIASYLELDETERAITTLPMSYTYGLSVITTHLYAGASVILTEKGVMQKAFWQQINAYQATSLAGVPYIYEMLERLHFFRMNLPYLRTMTQAGGKLSPALHQRFAEYALDQNKRFIVMYGATEATARMGYLPPERALDKCGSMGIPIPGGSFSLQREDGSIINGADEIGELVYKGANVTMGYGECGADLIKGDERGGVYHTGDMALRDKDGYYYITGRKKRFLKIFGSRVNLDEMEQLVKEQFKCCSCACAGTDDRMYVFVTQESQREAVKRFLIKKTGLNRKAIRVKYLSDIPKNSSGKTLYAALEAYYD